MLNLRDHTPETLSRELAEVPPTPRTAADQPRRRLRSRRLERRAGALEPRARRARRGGGHATALVVDRRRSQLDPFVKTC